jgi:hypothetical protein
LCAARRHVDPRVEARQPQRAAHREGQRGEPAEARQVLQRPQEQHQRRRDAEGNVVGQTVQLAPNRDCALSSRAIRPSIPSSMPARITASTAGLPESPVIAKRMPVSPRTAPRR